MLIQYLIWAIPEPLVPALVNKLEPELDIFDKKKKESLELGANQRLTGC